MVVVLVVLESGPIALMVVLVAPLLWLVALWLVAGLPPSLVVVGILVLSLAVVPLWLPTNLPLSLAAAVSSLAPLAGWAWSQAVVATGLCSAPYPVGVQSVRAWHRLPIW